MKINAQNVRVFIFGTKVETLELYANERVVRRKFRPCDWTTAVQRVPPIWVEFHLLVWSTYPDNHKQQLEMVGNGANHVTLRRQSLFTISFYMYHINDPVGASMEHVFFLRTPWCTFPNPIRLHDASVTWYRSKGRVAKGNVFFFMDAMNKLPLVRFSFHVKRNAFDSPRAVWWLRLRYD